MQTVKFSGVDWSAGNLSGDEIADAGYQFGASYLSTDWRQLEQSEVDSMRRRNVGIVIVGEYDKLDTQGRQISAMLGGRESGKIQAHYAANRRKALSLPDRQPIYATLDVPPGIVPWTLVEGYMRGWGEELGGKQFAGGYGGYDFIDFLVENDLADYRWQTYAWSRGFIHPKTMLYQYDIYGNDVAGIDVDLNSAFVDNYGQAQEFEKPTQPVVIWVQPLHPDWFAESLAVRYPTVGKWKWNNQNLTLHPLRHNAHVRTRTWQYAAPDMESGHAGPLLKDGVKVSIERMVEVKDVHGRERTWVILGNGTWIPEDKLDLDFTITPRKKVQG